MMKTKLRSGEKIKIKALKNRMILSSKLSLKEKQQQWKSKLTWIIEEDPNGKSTLQELIHDRKAYERDATGDANELVPGLLVGVTGGVGRNSPSMEFIRILPATSKHTGTLGDAAELLQLHSPALFRPCNPHFDLRVKLKQRGNAERAESWEMMRLRGAVVIYISQIGL